MFRTIALVLSFLSLTGSYATDKPFLIREKLDRPVNTLCYIINSTEIVGNEQDTVGHLMREDLNKVNALKNKDGMIPDIDTDKLDLLKSGNNYINYLQAEKGEIMVDRWFDIDDADSDKIDAWIEAGNEGVRYTAQQARNRKRELSEEIATTMKQRLLTEQAILDAQLAEAQSGATQSGAGSSGTTQSGAGSTFLQGDIGFNSNQGSGPGEQNGRGQSSDQVKMKPVVLAGRFSTHKISRTNTWIINGGSYYFLAHPATPVVLMPLHVSALVFQDRGVILFSFLRPEMQHHLIHFATQRLVQHHLLNLVTGWGGFITTSTVTSSWILHNAEIFRHVTPTHVYIVACNKSTHFALLHISCCSCHTILRASTTTITSTTFATFNANYSTSIQGRHLSVVNYIVGASSNVYMAHHRLRNITTIRLHDIPSSYSSSPMDIYLHDVTVINSVFFGSTQLRRIFLTWGEILIIYDLLHDHVRCETTTATDNDKLCTNSAVDRGDEDIIYDHDTAWGAVGKLPLPVFQTEVIICTSSPYTIIRHRHLIRLSTLLHSFKMVLFKRNNYTFDSGNVHCLSTRGASFATTYSSLTLMHVTVPFCGDHEASTSMTSSPAEFMPCINMRSCDGVICNDGGDTMPRDESRLNEFVADADTGLMEYAEIIYDDDDRILPFATSSTNGEHCHLVDVTYTIIPDRMDIFHTCVPLLGGTRELFKCAQLLGGNGELLSFYAMGPELLRVFFELLPGCDISFYGEEPWDSISIGSGSIVFGFNSSSATASFNGIDGGQTSGGDTFIGIKDGQTFDGALDLRSLDTVWRIESDRMQSAFGLESRGIMGRFVLQKTDTNGDTIYVRRLDFMEEPEQRCNLMQDNTKSTVETGNNNFEPLIECNETRRVIEEQVSAEHSAQRSDNAKRSLIWGAACTLPLLVSNTTAASATAVCTSSPCTTITSLRHLLRLSAQMHLSGVFLIGNNSDSFANETSSSCCMYASASLLIGKHGSGDSIKRRLCAPLINGEQLPGRIEKTVNVNYTQDAVATIGNHSFSGVYGDLTQRQMKRQHICADDAACISMRQLIDPAYYSSCCRRIIIAILLASLHASIAYINAEMELRTFAIRRDMLPGGHTDTPTDTLFGIGLLTFMTMDYIITSYCLGLITLIGHRTLNASENTSNTHNLICGLGYSHGNVLRECWRYSDATLRPYNVGRTLLPRVMGSHPLQAVAVDITMRHGHDRIDMPDITDFTFPEQDWNDNPFKVAYEEYRNVSFQNDPIQSTNATNRRGVTKWVGVEVDTDSISTIDTSTFGEIGTYSTHQPHRTSWKMLY